MESKIIKIINPDVYLMKSPAFYKQNISEYSHLYLLIIWLAKYFTQNRVE